MQNRYESFGVCLDRIIRERDLNAAQLSRILEHKSKTTLSRVFSGTAGLDSIRKICAEVCSSEELDLSEEEKTALLMAVEVEQFGAHTLRARDEISSLLRPAVINEPPILIHDGEKDRPLSEIYAEIGRADESEILVLNCSWKAFACELFTLLTSVAPEKLTVRHYMALNNDPARTASMIGTLCELFGFIHYSCYSISDRSNPTGPLDFMGMNGIAVRIRSGSEITEYQIIFTGEYRGMILKADGAYTYWDTYISQMNRNARPIKTTYPQVSSAEDYVTFTDIYRQTEENRNIYMY